MEGARSLTEVLDDMLEYGHQVDATACEARKEVARSMTELGAQLRKWFGYKPRWQVTVPGT